MIIRNGQALGSVLHSAEPKAPAPKPRSKKVESKSEPGRDAPESTVVSAKVSEGGLREPSPGSDA